MLRAELLEGDVLDQLLNDFESDHTEHYMEPETTYAEPGSHTSYRPQRVQGNDQTGFSQWINSKEEVRQNLQSKLGTPKITLDGCIKLYTDHNIKIDDPVVLWFPTADVAKYKEYDRNMENGWTGKMDQEEYDGLMQDIKANGIKNPGILDITNNGGAEYSVILGEGNHRLKIATELGQELFPLSFYYKYG